MKFSNVAQVFNEIEQVSGRLEITKKLADLLKQADPKDADIIANMSLGELYPPYRNAQFNFAQKSVICVVADLLSTSEDDIKKKVKKIGDLGLIVEQGDWDAANSNISIQEVYDQLVALQEISGVGSHEQKAEALLELLRELDPLSAKFVVRIVLGKLRLGFSDMTIIDALSWVETGDKSLKKIIEDAYNRCADIGYIASTLKKGGVKALEKISITVGIPIRPAAAERLESAQAIVDKLGPCVAQPKLDGFRLQVHIDNTHKEPRINFFSRNLKDMSAMFPDLVKALQGLKVDTLICEGEAICYDEKTDRFLPFQETVKRKRKHGIEEAITDYPLQLFLFDLLYLNGVSLLDETHDERYKKLLALASANTNNVIQTIDQKYVATGLELEDYFNLMLSEGLEGVVVKREDSIYQPGKRNFNWIKLKRQEDGSVEDTLDCVILGYYAGQGKRASFGIGAFLVGLRNAKTDQFETVAKVGTGMTDEQWKELKKKCDAITVPQKPNNVVCAKDLFPDVWVAPDLVCLIRADEITKSPMHAAGKTEDNLGLALRFPRFMGYRTDKSASDATTVKELQDMFEHQKK